MISTCMPTSKFRSINSFSNNLTLSVVQTQNTKTGAVHKKKKTQFSRLSIKNKYIYVELSHPETWHLNTAFGFQTSAESDMLKTFI